MNTQCKKINFYSNTVGIVSVGLRSFKHDYWNFITNSVLISNINPKGDVTFLSN